MWTRRRCNVRYPGYLNIVWRYLFKVLEIWYFDFWRTVESFSSLSEFSRMTFNVLYYSSQLKFILHDSYVTITTSQKYAPSDRSLSSEIFCGFHKIIWWCLTTETVFRNSTDFDKKCCQVLDWGQIQVCEILNCIPVTYWLHHQLIKRKFVINKIRYKKNLH